MPSLRVDATISIPGDSTDSRIDVDAITSQLWKHLNCYTLPGNEYTRWFLMDEGCALEIRPSIIIYIPFG